MTTFIDLRPSDEAAAVFPELHRVAVPTDESGDGMARSRRAATELAARRGWELVLYDRSHERWIDTPHPSGPFAADEVNPDERAHLVQQMHDIEAAGVPVSAWLATVPSLTSMVDAIHDLDVDGVVVPDELDRPKLMDRLLPRSRPAETLERVADLQLPGAPPVVLVVDEAGHISVATYEGDES